MTDPQIRVEVLKALIAGYAGRAIDLDKLMTECEMVVDWVKGGKK